MLEKIHLGDKSEAFVLMLEGLSFLGHVCINLDVK